MNLGNPYEALVYYLLIRGITSLGHRDRFPMISVLVCMVIHRTEPTMNHDIDYQVVMIHQTNILHDS